MRPPFSYFGAKGNLAPGIVAMMPAHDTYIEPFGGSLAVLFAKPLTRHEIVNDIDGAIVNFWRMLRDRPDDLERVCALSPYARAEWEACADIDDPTADELERARRLWVRANQSFAKRLNRTGWSVTTARTQAPPQSTMRRLGRFTAVAARLATVTIECCDGADLVERLATADAVVYADPTYVWATRRKDRQRLSDYRHELDDEDHRRLAKILHATPATVLLSGYPSALYDDLYGDWWRHDIAVTVHTDRRTEVIWSNRPLPERLAI